VCTFSNLLIPLQIGAHDMASVLWIWYRIGCSFIKCNNDFFFICWIRSCEFRWTIYPLSALRNIMVLVWVWPLVDFNGLFTFLNGSLNYIVTVINLRTMFMTRFRSLTIWAFFVTAIIGVVSFPVLLSLPYWFWQKFSNVFLLIWYLYCWWSFTLSRWFSCFFEHFFCS
jgi:cytochrome c oxidase subunit 1